MVLNSADYPTGAIVLNISCKRGPIGTVLSASNIIALAVSYSTAVKVGVEAFDSDAVSVVVSFEGLGGDLWSQRVGVDVERGRGLVW